MLYKQKKFKEEKKVNKILCLMIFIGRGTKAEGEKSWKVFFFNTTIDTKKSLSISTTLHLRNPKILNSDLIYGLFGFSCCLLKCWTTLEGLAWSHFHNFIEFILITWVNTRAINDLPPLACLRREKKKLFFVVKLCEKKLIWTEIIFFVKQFVDILEVIIEDMIPYLMLC